jgi:hypothetical protein
MKQELEQLTKSLGVFEKLEHGKCLQKKKKKKILFIFIKQM